MITTIYILHSSRMSEYLFLLRKDVDIRTAFSKLFEICFTHAIFEISLQKLHLSSLQYSVLCVFVITLHWYSSPSLYYLYIGLASNFWYKKHFWVAISHTMKLKSRKARLYTKGSYSFLSYATFIINGTSSCFAYSWMECLFCNFHSKCKHQVQPALISKKDKFQAGKDFWSRQRSQTI